MKRPAWIDVALVLVVLGLSAAVGAFVYSAPGLFACYWKSEDSDFCYAMTGIRWASGLRLLYMDHPGYTTAQYLGWFYTAAAKLGVVPAPSFNDFAADADPLVRIRPYVIAGWFAAFPVYAAAAIVAGAFSKLLTRSRLLAIVGSLLVLSSFPFIAWIINIRPEPLSVVCAYGSIFVLILACRSGRLLTFAALAIMSGTLLEFSLAAKVMSLPLLIFLPALFLIERSTPWDVAPHDRRRQALVALAAANLWLAPFSLLMVKAFIPDLMKSRWSLLMASVVLVNLLAISFVRRRARGTGTNPIANAGVDALFLALALLLGFQLGTRLGFVHPRLNIQESGVSIATDIGTSVFLMAHPDTQEQFVGELGLGRIVEAVRTTVPYYVKLRPIETLLAAVAIVLAVRRRRIEAAWIGFFLVLGFTMLAFASLRYIIDAYYPYEELATDLAAVGAIQYLWGELASRAPHMHRALPSIAVTIVVLALLGPRIRQTYRLRNAISCPPVKVLAGDTGCVCNPAYAARTGMKGFIEKYYGAPCADGVLNRVRRGLDERAR